MGFEEVKKKLEMTNLKIECTNNIYKESKKMNKRLILLGTATLIVVGFTSNMDNKISALDVICLASLVNTLHNYIRSYVDTKLDYQHNIKKLEIDKNYYESILDSSKDNIEMEIIQCEQ